MRRSGSHCAACFGALCLASLREGPCFINFSEEVELMLDEDTMKMLGLDCANTYKAVSAGAVTAWIGLDLLFARLGFSRRIHWALSGVAIDYYCRETMPDKRSMAGCAAAGFVGGFAVDFLQSTDLPLVFVGPMTVALFGIKPTF